MGARLQHAEVAGITLWEELLDAYNFTDSRSFPLFVSRAVRWLADEPAWHPYLAAGRPLPPPSADFSFSTAVDPALDALGAAYIPGAAGQIGDDAGSVREVALLSDAVTERHAGVPLAAQTAVGGLSGTGIATWLILAALLLLGLEWFLYQRGMMP